MEIESQFGHVVVYRVEVVEISVYIRDDGYVSMSWSILLSKAFNLTKINAIDNIYLNFYFCLNKLQ